MGKFLLGLATGLLLVFLTVVLIFFAAWRFRDRPPDIADNSVLVLRLQGEIPEKPPESRLAGAAPAPNCRRCPVACRETATLRRRSAPPSGTPAAGPSPNPVKTSP